MRCRVCGKVLTDPASVEAGIGPVCAARGRERRKREAARIKEERQTLLFALEDPSAVSGGADASA
jgi:hypothetical protein